MAESVWVGDKTNGIELRPFNDDPPSGSLMREFDEIVAYRDGEVVLHMECMSDAHYWFAVTVGDHRVDGTIASRSMRAEVVLRAEADS